MLITTNMITSRLELINQQRIERALSIMPLHQQNVFKLIPALLHFNDPQLPAYNESGVSLGVSNFVLDDTQEQLLANFQFYPHEHQIAKSKIHNEILGLYAMGSTSSIGQNLKSDLDIWVCVPENVGLSYREHLVTKCALITNWAREKLVEVNFFIVDQNKFKRSFREDVLDDNCGSSQHLLLLEEFYRSAVKMMGKNLLWNIVPPEMETNYIQYIDKLVAQKELNQNDWIDFGMIHHIPVGEYFGSSLWQLYKSIDSPYKSVLKTLLLEAYIHEYPKTQLISTEIKQRFFAGEDDLDKLDPYILMLDKVTKYLYDMQDEKRLDLIRRCFYLKVGEKLSVEKGSDQGLWQRLAVTNIVDSWNWQPSILKDLDNRASWKIESVKKIHHSLLDALMQSYRQLILFARHHDITASISPQDVNILSRKLYVAFEVLPNKITLLNKKNFPNLKEDNLSFIHVPSGKINKPGWYIYNNAPNKYEILKRSYLEHHEYLSKLVAWAFFNGLISEFTNLYTIIAGAKIDTDKFYQMVDDLQNTFDIAQDKSSLKALASPCEIDKLAVFINFEKDPTIDLSDDATTINLQNINALSFDDNQLNLIGSIDIVYRNSWHEIRTMHFNGEMAVLDALKSLLNKIPQRAFKFSSMEIFCYSKHYRTGIRNFMHQLLSECITLRVEPKHQLSSRRFKALHVGTLTYGIFFERRMVSIQRLEKAIDFYQSISINKVKDSPLLKFDQEYLIPDVVDNFASEGLMQFFFEDTINGFNIYVLDEANNIEVYHRFNSSKDEMISSLNGFYTTTKKRNLIDVNEINFNLPQYYQIVHPENGEAYVVPYHRNVIEKNALQQKEAKAHI